MTEIEKQALALVEGILPEDAYRAPSHFIDKRLLWNALCRALEQKAALQAEFDQFRQEVSDAVVAALKDAPVVTHSASISRHLSRFILPRPDPLVEAMREACKSQGFATKHTPGELAEHFRAALAKRNAHIVWEAE